MLEEEKVESVLPWVYVHSSICQTYLVKWFSRSLYLNGGGGVVSQGYVVVL